VKSGFSTARPPGVVLFDEDFDQPPPGPEMIEPVYSAAELLAAKEDAAREARDIAIAEAEAQTRSRVSHALTAIATHLADARDSAAAIADQSAEAIARLLLRCFAATFPALSARHGETEVAALLRALLPTLHRQLSISVRVHPDLIVTLTEELASLDHDIASRVRVIPAAAMAHGDARVAWDHGAAARDTASLWSQIENILAPAGLLEPINAPQPQPAMKDHAIAD
jgi:flagellar biosynthesis/type III secretory pathway protein FliH